MLVPSRLVRTWLLGSLLLVAACDDTNASNASRTESEATIEREVMPLTREERDEMARVPVPEGSAHPWPVGRELRGSYVIEEALGTRGAYHLYRVRHVGLDREYTVYSPTDQSGGVTMIEINQRFQEAHGSELDLVNLVFGPDGIFLVVVPKE